MPFAFSYNQETEPPFVIFVAHEDKARGGNSWRPQARLCVMPALRSCGLIEALDANDFTSLVLLLSFVSPDGWCRASVPELSRALCVSHRQAHSRFERLALARWQGQAIVLRSARGGGLDGFSPAPGFVPVVEEQVLVLMPSILQVLPRETVIEHSRRSYARRREEVEREIGQMMGWDKKQEAKAAEPEMSPDEQKLRGELLGAGLLPEQAQELMERFDPVRIRRQLMWLPYRAAKNPAGYLLAAVKDDYAAPRGMVAPKKEHGDEGE